MKVRWADEDSRDKHVTFDPPGEDSSPHTWNLSEWRENQRRNGGTHVRPGICDHKHDVGGGECGAAGMHQRPATPEECCQLHQWFTAAAGRHDNPSESASKCSD